MAATWVGSMAEAVVEMVASATMGWAAASMVEVVAVVVAAATTADGGPRVAMGWQAAKAAARAEGGQRGAPAAGLAVTGC